jgi:hypothetical protein
MVHNRLYFVWTNIQHLEEFYTDPDLTHFPTTVCSVHFIISGDYTELDSIIVLKRRPNNL